MLSRRAFVGNLGALAVALVAAPAVLESAAPDVVAPVTLSPGEGVAFEIGDVFTIAGRYALNPMTHRPMPHLQQFVVTETATAGEIALRPAQTIYPRLIDRGPYANVSSAAPFQASDIHPIPWGCVQRSRLKFHRNAFALTWDPA